MDRLAQLSLGIADRRLRLGPVRLNRNKGSTPLDREARLEWSVDKVAPRGGVTLISRLVGAALASTVLAWVAMREIIVLERIRGSLNLR